MSKRRNPLGSLPILRKGGAHQRSRSGCRAIDRRVLMHELDDWCCDERENATEWLDGKAVEPFSSLPVQPASTRYVTIQPTV